MIFKIAHRGASGYEPENTLLAFKKAIELKADMIELDVHKCKSGELVVIHDEKLDRATNGTGYVAEKTIQQLRRLDAGKGQKIPTLQEVLDLVDRKIKVNIELKGEGTAKPVFKVIENYVKRRGWSYDDFLISSFDHYELLRFNKLNPKIKIGALISGIPIDFVAFAKKINAYSVNLCVDAINKRFVEDAHKKSMKVFVWTVNDFEDIRRMKKLGVDGIFSDYPDRI